MREVYQSPESRKTVKVNTYTVEVNRLEGLEGLNRPELGLAGLIGIQYCSYSKPALAFVGHSD